MLIPSSFTGDTAFIYMQQIRHSQHPHHSPLPAGRNFSRLTVRTLLRPADLLASLTDPTLLALCRLRLLLRSFRSEKSLSLPSGMTTVVTGQVLLAGSPPAGLAASFAALHVVSRRARVLQTTQDRTATRDSVAAVLPSSYSERSRHPDPSAFRSSIPRPPMPLSTLRNAPHGGARKTRGQDGVAVLLSCRALASPTTCRFIPALSELPTIRPEPVKECFACSRRFLLFECFSTRWINSVIAGFVLCLRVC